jgi:hypothetical protein
MEDDKITAYGNAEDQDFSDAFYQKAVEILSKYNAYLQSE